jgi:hypothetical protein
MLELIADAKYAANVLPNAVGLALLLPYFLSGNPVNYYGGFSSVCFR